MKYAERPKHLEYAERRRARGAPGSVLEHGEAFWSTAQHPECAERQECEEGVERMEHVEFLEYVERLEWPGMERSVRESC